VLPPNVGVISSFFNKEVVSTSSSLSTQTLSSWTEDLPKCLLICSSEEIYIGEPLSSPATRRDRGFLLFLLLHTKCTSVLMFLLILPTVLLFLLILPSVLLFLLILPLLHEMIILSRHLPLANCSVASLTLNLDDLYSLHLFF
jgi:hypothetical protein